MARIVLATCLLLRLSSVAAQVPRGFARPAAASGGAQPAAPEAGVTNAKLGMAGLQQLAKDPYGAAPHSASLSPRASAQSRWPRLTLHASPHATLRASPRACSARSRASIQKVMASLMEDPDAVAEAKKMMQDPSFQREMEKIAGPMKQARARIPPCRAGAAGLRGWGARSESRGDIDGTPCGVRPTRPSSPPFPSRSCPPTASRPRRAGHAAVCRRARRAGRGAERPAWHLSLIHI